ncbi:hypothetical protein AALA82_11700 [Oscillospiraceae bacterium 50-16]
MSEKNVGNMFYEALEKVKDGRQNYEVLYLGDKGPIYRSGGYSGPVTDAITCLVDSEGNITHCEWSEGKSPTDAGEITAILKKRKRLLLSDKDVGYFASGVGEDAGGNVKKALLYFRCNGIATLIVASSDLPTVQAVDYLTGEGDDPLRVILHDLLNMQDGAQRKEAIDGAEAD